MATVTSMLSDIVAATLQPQLDIVTLESSSFMGNLYKSSKGVWTNPRVGKDWKVTRNFALGLAGGVEMGSMAGPDVSDVGSAVGFNVYNQVDTWPGLGETTVPAFLTRELTLKKMKVTAYVPSTVMRLAALKASIGDEMSLTIKGLARNILYNRAGMFLSDSNSSLGSFTTGGGGGTISSSGLQVSLNSGSSIRRFTSGLRVDVFATGTSTRLNTAPVFVDTVDAFGTSGSPVTSGGGTLKLYQVGTASTVLGATTTYDIALRNSGRELATPSAKTPTSLNTVIVDTGSPYGINVDNVPELKSLCRDLGGATLTGGQLLKYIGHYVHARGGLDGIDSLWAQAGVWNAYYNSLNTEFTIERNGAIVNVKDGFAKQASYSTGGYNLPFMVDSWFPENTVFGLKTKNNWTLITPPRIAGTGASAAVDNSVEFMWPLMNGGSDIFGGYRKVGGPDAGAFTDFMEAPGEHCFEIACESLPGIKLTNVADYYG